MGWIGSSTASTRLARQSTGKAETRAIGVGAAYGGPAASGRAGDALRAAPSAAHWRHKWNPSLHLTSPCLPHPLVLLSVPRRGPALHTSPAAAHRATACPPPDRPPPPCRSPCVGGSWLHPLEQYQRLQLQYSGAPESADNKEQNHHPRGAKIGHRRWDTGLGVRWEGRRRRAGGCRPGGRKRVKAQGVKRGQGGSWGRRGVDKLQEEERASVVASSGAGVGTYHAAGAVHLGVRCVVLCGSLVVVCFLASGLAPPGRQPWAASSLKPGAGLSGASPHISSGGASKEPPAALCSARQAAPRPLT